MEMIRKVLEKGPRKALSVPKGRISLLDPKLSNVAHVTTKVKNKQISKTTTKNVIKEEPQSSKFQIVPKERISLLDPKLSNVAHVTTKVKHKQISKTTTSITSVIKEEPQAQLASNISLKSSQTKEKEDITTEDDNLEVNLKNVSLLLSSILIENGKKEDITAESTNLEVNMEKVPLKDTSILIENGENDIIAESTNLEVNSFLIENEKEDITTDNNNQEVNGQKVSLQNTSVLIEEEKNYITPHNYNLLAERQLTINSKNDDTPEKIPFNNTSLLIELEKKFETPKDFHVRFDPPPLQVTSYFIEITKKINEFKNVKFADINFSGQEEPNIEEIDEYFNPLYHGYYVDDIYDYLFSLEKKNCVRPDYLKSHRSLKPYMRPIVVDWLFAVHQEFELKLDTLYLTVAILDRFLQSSTIATRSNIQLIGIASMMIASKYEEIYLTPLARFVDITDNTFTINEMKSMECAILKQIDFNLGYPLRCNFLRRLKKIGNVKKAEYTLANLLMQLTLLDDEWLHVPASAVAAGSLYLSLLMNNDYQKGLWPEWLSYTSRYSTKDLRPVIRLLAIMFNNVYLSKYQAVRMRFTSKKYLDINQPYINSKFQEIISGHEIE